MTVYVAEIEGRSIVAFDAETRCEAETLTDAEWLKEDLMVLESNGQPLWDGNAEIYIREAFEDERDKWDSSRARALLEEEIDADEEWIIYLVPVSEPADDEDC
jgi:hypothetical protein